ncbi:hypothetical protein [Agromyces sp. PvR057]|uniref:hypothetical protein n=1 Tax=Agromyces sp. PvR057 TaxID=3156403 RepID=UPI000E272897
MADGTSERAAERPEPATDPELLEREMMLVDQVIGLEARIAELSAGTRLTPSEQLGVEHQIAEMRRSVEWRAGRLITLPARVLRRVWPR